MLLDLLSEIYYGVKLVFTTYAASDYTSNTDDVFLEHGKLQVPAVIKSWAISHRIQAAASLGVFIC